MKKILLIVGMFLSGIVSFTVFANFYDTANIERIDENSFGGRIVEEAIFVYPWVQNYGASSEDMRGVLKDIEDINDGRKLYDNASYIAEKYEGQPTQKLFVKDVNSLDVFIEGQTSTIAHRCTLSNFECELLSDAQFAEGKEYYIKMTDDTPFYINFCKDPTNSYISGRGCVETHERCANGTGLQRILEEDGVTEIPVSNRTCGCSEGQHLNEQVNKCLSEGETCDLNGDDYDSGTRICTKTVTVTTGETYTCSSAGFAGRKHVGFSYPPNVQSSDLDLDGDDALTFVSTGNRSGGRMYEWLGYGCRIDNYGNGSYNRFLCDGNDGDYLNDTQPEAGAETYLSLRAACGETYGMEERTAELTIEYYETLDNE